MIRKTGVDLIETLTLPDHVAPTVNDLKSFVQKSCLKGAHCVLCTEKDAVKMDSFPAFAIPVIPMQMQLEITQGKEHWNKALDHMKQKVMA
jgi:tetraacyldisaccharide-1-P 4'-kinase